jgi:hypothetical protein
MAKTQTNDRLRLREAIGFGLLGGLLLGVVEVWFGLVGGWASGRQLLLFGASIGSAITFTVLLALLHWLIGYRSRFSVLVLAPVVGGISGLVFSLIYNQGTVSWSVAGIGAAFATLMAIGVLIEEHRNQSVA